MKKICRENKTKEDFFELIIELCDMLIADEKLVVTEFGLNKDLELHMFKDCYYDKEKDVDYSNLVTITTLQYKDVGISVKKLVVVDDTGNIYVTDGELNRELERIWNYSNFSTF